MAIDVETAVRRQAREFAERSIERLATHIDKLTAAKVRPIIIGGWAVTAHGSPLGSRDIDALIHSRDQRVAGDALGNTDFVARHLEGDSLFDYDFYDATNRSRLGFPYQFRYDEVLDRHTVRKTLRYKGGTVTIRVPDASSLFFLKAKAFADRSHAYYLCTHPEELRRFEDEVKRFVHDETAEYWAAKTAKDMDDLAFLSGLHLSRTRLAKLISDSGLRRYAVIEWTRRVPEVYEVADRIRAEAGEAPRFVASRYEAVLGLLA